MKTVLITGAYGFIGANLLRRLLHDGYNVHTTSRGRTNGWRTRGLDFPDHVCDIRDRDQVERVVRDVKPNIVYHLATYGAYPTLQQDLDVIMQTNVIGSINLMQALSKTNCEVFVNSGSCSEYGLKSAPMIEDDVLNPINAYGISKMAITHLCRIGNLPAVTVRPFSVYGYYEESTRLIPYVIANCLRGKEIKLTSGEQVRDFTFIEDAVDAYVLAGTTSAACGKVFNIGAGKQHTVKETVQIIVALCDKKIDIQWGLLPYRSGETNCWEANSNRAKELLGWIPKHTLTMGLRKTVEWFKEGGLERY